MSLLFFCYVNCYTMSSKSKDKDLIHSFLTNLLDESISSSEIVNDFMYIGSKSKDSLDILTEGYEKLIEMARSDLGSKSEDWSLINPKIRELNEWHIFEYSKYRELDEVNLNFSEKEINNTYVLLDENKKEILQYFWIKNGKINSFSLFIQGHSAWFFVYH